MRFVPAEPGLLPGECTETDAGFGPLVLEPRAPYLIEIENTGRSDLYVTVLNVLPDGQVSQLLPFEHQSPELLTPDVGPWRPQGVCFYAGEQAGTEVLKVIATDTPMSFAPVLTSRGAGEAPANPLEALMHATWTGDSRGVGALDAAVNGATAEVGIVVKP